MTSRSLAALATFATLALISLAACDTGTRIPGLAGSQNSSAIRIVNASAGAVDLTSNGQVVGSSGHVNAGATSACISIDPATTTLGLREEGALRDLAGFAPALIPGAHYTLVAFTSDAGTTSALSLLDQFTVTSGLSALRVVDVAPGLGSLDVYVTPNGAPLGVPSTASIGYAGNTGFFDANPGTSQVRFTVATTPTLVYDAGPVTLGLGQLYTMVLAQPAGPATTPVATLVPSC